MNQTEMRFHYVRGHIHEAEKAILNRSFKAAHNELVSAEDFLDDIFKSIAKGVKNEIRTGITKQQKPSK